MPFLFLIGCLYRHDYLDWVYTQLEDDDQDGFREIDGDCDDEDPEVFPGVYEICDGIDNDCNGDADGDALDILAWYQDRDGDGYGNNEVVRLSCEPVPTFASVGQDCDDADSAIHPSAPIQCGENLDRDCDGVEEDLDQDQDGYAWCAECSDLDPRVHPGASERCNEIDDDCDGVVDGPEADERPWYPDADGDLYGDQELELISCDPPEDYIVDGGDCDDQREDVHPAAAELCLNGLDDNCDGLVDDADPALDRS
ncbi:MAG TPA: putative metal-binding motif-containing protein, partial [Myxococcota bacterium]|nr:putative metal-binding motif-containing protein [Myxococcota bacterium]